MICHMKVHIVSYNLDQKKFSKSKIHILPNYEQTNLKTAIVNSQTLSYLCKGLLFRLARRMPTSDGNRTVLSREVPGRSQDGTGQDRT